MNSRERVSTVLNGGQPDRIPRSTGYWGTTAERWWREGLPAGVSPGEYFGTDEIGSIIGDFSMQFPERVMSEEKEKRTYWDRDGALRTDMATPEGSTTQWHDFTIKTRDDWLEHRHRMDFNEARIPADAKPRWEQMRAAGKAIYFQAHACFHPTWSRIGMVEEMMLMKEDPEFIRELYSAQIEVVLDLFDAMVQRGLDFDGAFIADDLGYVHSPLISPAMYEDLVLPYHRQLCEHFAAAGLKTILHSDGNIGPLIPLFLEAGFAGLNPLEAKAHLDVRELKPKYGDRLVFHGNIDVTRLAGTREEVEEEITGKIPIAMEGGGYIFGVDHGVPNDVPFENFKLAIELLERHGVYG